METIDFRFGQPTKIIKAKNVQKSLLNHLSMKNNRDLSIWLNEDYDLDYIKTNVGYSISEMCIEDLSKMTAKEDYQLMIGQYKFFTTFFEGIRYVIVENSTNALAITILEWWLKGANGDLVDGEIYENTWETWQVTGQGIAYRGGSGYIYALYAKLIHVLNTKYYRNNINAGKNKYLHAEKH